MRTGSARAQYAVRSSRGVLFRSERRRGQSGTAGCCPLGRTVSLGHEQSHVHTEGSFGQIQVPAIPGETPSTIEECARSGTRILEKSRTGGVDAAVVLCVLAGLCLDRARVAATHATGRCGRIALVSRNEGNDETDCRSGPGRFCGLETSSFVGCLGHFAEIVSRSSPSRGQNGLTPPER